LLVKSYDGRPIKIEGNPQHPIGRRGTDPFAQASILSLYDPDRAMHFRQKGEAVKPEAAFDFLAQLAKSAGASQGRGLYFLAEQSGSPSRAPLQQILQIKYPQSSWHEYEPIDLSTARRAASEFCGTPASPDYAFDQARCVVSLDADFLGTEPDSFWHISRFARGRTIASVQDAPTRLYVIEALMTLTGANADRRLRILASQIPAVAARLLKESGGTNLPADLVPVASGFKGNDAWVRECAQDLAANRGASLVIAGHRQPPKCMCSRFG
jgi:molybdopterin-containing oxidoreductase family iron-sulfur binding subunit